jgi:hypothetical protein
MQKKNKKTKNTHCVEVMLSYTWYAGQIILKFDMEELH